MIGIGVTTRNRRPVVEKTLVELRRYLPAGAKLVVVDDASVDPFPNADWRFPVNVGIARAKNKCLELLDGCNDIFLFDDDTYPRCDGWHHQYVESDQPHLMYMFGKLANGYLLRDGAKCYEDDKHVAWSHPRGCMLYFKRTALDVVGGFDPAFGTWGWEHVNLSDRIYTAGLTNWPYQDVVGSERLVCSGDEDCTVKSTVDPQGPRHEHLVRTTALYKELSAKRGYYVDYRQHTKIDAVVTCYFAGMDDAQRPGVEWKADEGAVAVLRESVALQAPRSAFHVLNNCFARDRVVVSNLSPYWQRWVTIYDWLRQNPQINNVWCVDATDVEMLRNPFERMKPGVIYVGHEPAVMGIPWMLNMHPAQFLQDYFKNNANLPLLNCGVVGGSRVDIMEFIRAMLTRWAKNNADVTYKKDKTVGATDMGLFNYICNTDFKHRLEKGPHVVTGFKSFKDNGQAWWRHK